MDLSKYFVLDFGETLEYKARALEKLPLGHEYSVKLRKEFLADAPKLTSVKLDANQRMNLDLGNDFSRLHRPDNSREEKTWYAQLRMKGTTRDRDSGYMPGQVVSKDGIMFVGPDVGGSLFMAPGGELYLTKQVSLRDQQIEAFRLGVVNSAGGVILAWAVVAIGAAALAAPVVLSATSTWIASMAGGGATATGVYQSIITHRLLQWLGLHWPALLAEGSFYVTLGGVAISFDVRTFVRLLREDPEAALKMLVQMFAELGHSHMEARTAVPGGGSYRRGTPDVDPNPSPTRLPPRTLAAPDDDVVPSVTPAPTRMLPPVDDPVLVVTPAPPVARPDTTLKRMIGDALVKQGKPANDTRMTNPSTQPDVAEDALAQAPALVLKGTGTDGFSTSVTGDETTGVPMMSRSGRNDRSTGPTKGSVVSSTNSNP